MDFFTKSKYEREDEKRANQFIRIYGNVSHILGLSNPTTQESDILQLLEKLEKPESSDDVFIAITLLINSKRKNMGFIFLMRAANSIQQGSSVKNTLNLVPNKTLASIFQMLYDRSSDIDTFLENVPDDISNEPLELF